MILALLDNDYRPLDTTVVTATKADFLGLDTTAVRDVPKRPSLSLLRQVMDAVQNMPEVFGLSDDEVEDLDFFIECWLSVSGIS